MSHPGRRRWRHVLQRCGVGNISKHYGVSHGSVPCQHFFLPFLTETYFCCRNLFQWQNIFSVRKTCFCQRNFFCDRNLFFWWKLDGNVFCWQKVFFMWHKLVFVTVTCFCDRNVCPWEQLFSLTAFFFVAFSRDSKGTFSWKIEVFVISDDREIMPLWSPDFRNSSWIVWLQIHSRTEGNTFYRPCVARAFLQRVWIQSEWLS